MWVWVFWGSIGGLLAVGVVASARRTRRVQEALRRHADGGITVRGGEVRPGDIERARGANLRAGGPGLGGFVDSGP